MTLTYSPQEFADQLSSNAAEAVEYGPYRGRVRNRIKRSCDCGEWCISTCNQRARRDGVLPHSRLALISSSLFCTFGRYERSRLIIVIVEGDVVDGATAEMVIAASGAR
jgi:hypothetical protein